MNIATDLIFVIKYRIVCVPGVQKRISPTVLKWVVRSYISTKQYGKLFRWCGCQWCVCCYVLTTLQKWWWCHWWRNWHVTMCCHLFSCAQYFYCFTVFWWDKRHSFSRWGFKKIFYFQGKSKCACITLSWFSFWICRRLFTAELQ